MRSAASRLKLFKSCEKCLLYAAYLGVFSPVGWVSSPPSSRRKPMPLTHGITFLAARWKKAFFCKKRGLRSADMPHISHLVLVSAHRLAVRTAPFHGADRGSIPLGRTRNFLVKLGSYLVLLTSNQADRHRLRGNVRGYDTSEILPPGRRCGLDCVVHFGDRSGVLKHHVRDEILLLAA
jgi:hypothetical protein